MRSLSNETDKPFHPGSFVRVFALKKFSVAEIAQRSGLPEDSIQDLIDEKVPFDDVYAAKLSVIFGKATESLVRQQFIYDYFQKNNHRPSAEEVSQHLTPLLHS